MVKQLAETRVRISLNDELSTGLSKAQRNVAGFNKSITATSGAFGGVVSNITGLTAALTGLYGAIDLTAQAIKAPFDFAKSIETNKLGIAGIMQSMLQLNGRTLQWQESLALSDKVITKLNENALKTAATSKDLVEAFRALLGPGIAAGMSMKEIVEYSTVGANAVKSLGLERQQVVQEIRDLVQGGIRAQSSILAVSLGLTDKDIAEAKKSSEGLYNFLMKRLEGFKMSARETPKTMQGLLDQVAEGYTRSTATGTEPLYEYYKGVLSRVSDLFLDNQSFQLNQSYIDSVREFSEHAVNAAEGLETAGRVIGTVISPAVDLAGSTMGVLADNTDKVVLGFAGLKAGQIAVDLYKVANASKDTYEAQTTLGGVLQKGKSYFTSYGAAAELAARKEKASALDAANKVVASQREKERALRNQQEVERAVNKLIKSEHEQLAKRLAVLADRYKLMGISARDAAEMQLQVARLVNKGQTNVAVDVIKEQEAHAKKSLVFQKEAEALEKLQSNMLQFGGTVTGVSLAMSTLSTDTDSFVAKLGDTGLAIGTGITALGLLIEQVDKLKKAYDAATASGVAAGLLNAGTAAGAAVGAIGGVGIGLGVGALAAMVIAQIKGISYEEAVKLYTQGRVDNNVSDFKRGQDTNIIKVNENELGPKFTKEQLDKLKRAKQKVELLYADLDMKIKGFTENSLAVANARITKEITKMNATLDEARAAGVSEAEISKIEADIKRYKELAEKQNARNYLTEEHNMQMNLLQTMEDTYAEHYSVLDRMRAEEAERYRQRLLDELQNTELTEKEKLRLRQEYANATEQLNKAQSTNLDAAFKQSLDYLKNVQYDQVATVKSGIDEMLGAITNFGQNMLIEQKSFSDRSDELFKDLANSIINTMMKVIMQGLVMNSIMSIFGGGGGNAKYNLATDFKSAYGINYSGGFAKGGIANGWAMVGEEGPELVNFSNPSRVYTAEQTAKALNSGGGDVNVKINMVNQSGQQLQVEQTGGGFDGESYIVNVVINAVANNKNGMRTILKGAMAR